MDARIFWLALSLPLAACQARTPIAPKLDVERVRRPEARDMSSYARAASYDELKGQFEGDLERGDWADADRGLEAFFAACTLDEHATLGHQWMVKLRPSWRYQLRGATQYIARCESRIAILAREAGQELSEVHGSIERNDMHRLRALRADSRSLLGSDAIAGSGDLAAHATLVDGWLAFDGWRRAGSAPTGPARAVATSMDGCAASLERQGFGSAGFVARILAAETLDLAGLRGEAIERWLALRDSRFLAEAPESVKVAIAGRIRSFSEALRAELTARIRAEEQELARQQIAEAERRHEQRSKEQDERHAHAIEQGRAELEELELGHAKLSMEQRSRIDALEQELTRVGARKDAEARASLDLQRAGFEDTLEHQVRRIRELEALFVEIATAKATDWRSGSESFLESTGNAISFSADVLTIWQAASKLRAAGATRG